jgi:hypothetical protein
MKPRRLGAAYAWVYTEACGWEGEFTMKTTIVLFFLLTLPASAALVEQDLFTAGDGLLTLDDATGLLWLDLTETTGLSMDDILADIGGWS